MEIRLLRTFKAVADAGSFTRAAQRVHLTQAAVSIQIKALEDELGTPLFLRVNKKIHLTEAGKLLRERAGVILRNHDETKAELGSLRGIEPGLLRIGIASASISSHPLPDILIELKRRHPRVEVQVHGGTSERIVSHILSDEIDVGLVSLPVEEKGIWTKRLRSDGLVAVAPPSWPRTSSRGNLSAKALAAEPMILGERGGNTRRLIDLYFQKADVEPRIIMELNRTDAIKRMVELGFGVSILPWSSVRREVAAGQLRSLSVRGMKLHWQLGIAALQSAFLPPLVHTFVELCESQFGDQEMS
jgi:DNA-binding transcriptional LysR family regulator